MGEVLLVGLSAVVVTVAAVIFAREHHELK
jgi:hypothetical protein